MRLTQFTDFGLRALMRLAAEPERAFTTEQLADELRISRNHLTKIIGDLARSGYLKTQRGAAGGVRLASPADAIRLGDIVRLLERHQAMVECFRADGGGCSLTPTCRLRSRLARAEAAFLAALDGATLADCASPRERSEPATA